MQDQLIELETKLAFQDDLIQTLNHTVSGQQQELLELRRDIEELQEQVRNLAPQLGATITDEPPPHY